MIKQLKYLITTILLFAIFSTSFANKDRVGFLTNIRELKEISDIMDIISENYVGDKDLKKKDLMQGALKGMLESLDDPNSVYLTKEELKSFQEDIVGKYVGVGLSIQKKVNDYIEVISPIEDGPGLKAGVKSRDLITAINGESVLPLTSEECIKRLKGKVNTKVKVTIYRKSDETTKDIFITRELVQLKYVKSKMLENKIGYLRLTQFGENVYTDLAKAVDNMQKNGMKALVFDLRNNPGGALDQGIKIASMFVKNGRIVSVKTKNGKETVYNREGKYFGDFPLVILINGGSASASEIVAAAIKENNRGYLIGEKSFGKGSVQTILPLPDGDGIKLTIAKYYTPNLKSIHGKGIDPNFKIEDKDYYMLFDGFITNIDEKETKNRQNKVIKENLGADAAKKAENHTDIQLEKAVDVLKLVLDGKDPELLEKQAQEEKAKSEKVKNEKAKNEKTKNEKSKDANNKDNKTSDQNKGNQ